MCLSKPKVEKPKEYQPAKEPVFREAEQSNRGRRGTILAGSGSVVPSAAAPGAKKTQLGM